jgi:hypothetical protein
VYGIRRWLGLSATAGSPRALTGMVVLISLKRRRED